MAIRETCDDITSTGNSGESIISLPTKCHPRLEPNEIVKAVSDILKLKIANKLTRQHSDLDLKLTSGALFIKRTEPQHLHKGLSSMSFRRIKAHIEKET